MTTKSYLPELVRKDLFGVVNIKLISNWNTAFANSLDYKSLRMEDMGQLPLNSWQFGDVVIWPKPGFEHVGVCIGGYIYNSKGRSSLPKCLNNTSVDNGPRLIPITPGWVNGFGSGIYRIFRPTLITGALSVVIGSQEWTTTNLDISNYRNGDPIPQVTDPVQWANLTTGAWCYYNNDPNNGVMYGKLYNWYAANDSRGLAPKGWHIPSEVEWTTLTTFLGGETVAGGKMKAVSQLWQAPNTGATNSSGFTGLPGGYHVVYGPFNKVGYDGYWWSSSEYDATGALGPLILYSISGIAYRNAAHKGNGFSVRCLRD